MGKHLLPREHGAWVQLVLPAATVMVMGRPGLAAWALCGAALALFVAHESLVVLMGLRGARAASASGRRARVIVTSLGALALGLGAVGLTRASGPVVVSLAAAVLPATLAVGMLWRRRLRTTAAEVAVAASLAGLALPIGLSCALTSRAAVTVWLVWLATFVSMTLAARGVLALAKKRSPSRRLSKIALAVATGSVATASGLWLSGRVGAAVPVALAPSVLLCAALALRPPPAQRLMQVGFAMLAAALLTLGALVTGPL